MSSLMQFRGSVTSRGVGLQMYLTEKEECYSKKMELIDCPCGKQHPQIHIAYRKPAGMFGCWVVFRMNGKEIVPDLSVPMNITKLPRDAIKLTPKDNSLFWHS